MIHHRRFLAATTALGVALVAGCGSSSSSSATKPSGSASSASAAGTTSAAATSATSPSTPAGAASSPAKSSLSASGKFEVFSWWTSGSENAALTALFDATKKAFPKVEIVNAAVAGGAGSNAQQVLATRLSGGDVPETWQTHAGGALGDYVKQDVVQDLSSLYASNGWNKALPKAILDSLTYDGKIYAVPTGVHRGNVVWYNKSLLAKAGVTLGAGATWDQIQTAATTLKTKGITPLCLGDKDIWTAATLLESILIGAVGPEGWAGLLDGSKKWSDPQVVAAVNDFVTALKWTPSDHKALDWTGAVTALSDGKCAMNVMGDWEYGELVVKHKQKDGTDFGATIIGDPSTFDTVTDVFVLGKGSKNPDAGKAWLTSILNPDAQVAFAKAKGSSPARTDLSTSTLGAYQQIAAKTLASGHLVPSLIQGAANIPASINQAFSDSTTLLEANGNASAFAKAMDTAVAAGPSS